MSKRTWLVGVAGVAVVALLLMIGRSPNACQPTVGRRCRSRRDRVRRSALSRGRLRGLRYRLLRHHPVEDVSDLVLADRIRSSIGPLVHQLDLPHIHVMVHAHIAMLHGDVAVVSDAEQLSEAVNAVSGVRGVESFLHVGLLASETRPSRDRGEFHPASPALEELLNAAREAGARDAPLFAVHAVLGAFLDLVPEEERNHVFAHLPNDVQVIVTSPKRVGEHRAKARSVDDLVARIAASDPRLDDHKAGTVATAVLRVLRELVPEERDHVAAVLPRGIRDVWQGLGSPTTAS